MLAWPLVVALLGQAGQAPPPAAVAGQVHTRDGAPVVAIRVSAIVAAPPDARPEDGIQYYLDPPPVATTLTNAQGRFRLPPIPPGRYVIVAGIQGRATYFPSVTEAIRATVVTVGGPTTRTDNLEITLAQAIGGRVRGTISPPPADATSEIAVLSGQQFTELVEMPVAADGSFDFGNVPSGRYLLNFFPTPPGGRSVSFQVETGDIPPIQYMRPPTHAVTGRLVVEKGPLPSAILGFRTPDSYVTATINPDGTFVTRLHAGQHLTELGGMPVGYDLRSVRIGNVDAATGIAVKNADVSNVVITVKAPAQLPRLRGRVMGAPVKARVQVTGPIVGSPSTAIAADGTFEFPALVPGLYYVRVPEAPALGTTLAVVTAQGSNDVVIGAAQAAPR